MFVSDVLLATLGVAALLIVALLAGRFVGYLADAVQGKLNGTTLLLILGLRLPEFVALLSPLALLAGTTLAMSRMVADGEMIALRSAGLSHRTLAGWALAAALPVMVPVAICALWLTPAIKRNMHEILVEYGALDQFAGLRAGRFTPSPDGRVTLFSRAISADGKTLIDVFIAEQSSARVAVPGHMNITVAEQARQVTSAHTGSRFLVLSSGHRYEGTPGRAGFRVAAFDRLGQRMTTSAVDLEVDAVEAQPAIALLRGTSPAQRAELQWRLLQPLLVPLAGLIALAAAPTTARNGRFRVVASVLAYIGIFFAFAAMKDAIASHALAGLGNLMLPAALIFAAIGAWLMADRP